MYLQLDGSRSSLQYRVFIIFQVTVLPALILAQVEPKYAIQVSISQQDNARIATINITIAYDQLQRTDEQSL